MKFLNNFNKTKESKCILLDKKRFDFMFSPVFFISFIYLSACRTFAVRNHAASGTTRPYQSYRKKKTNTLFNSSVQNYNKSFPSYLNQQ